MARSAAAALGLFFLCAMLVLPSCAPKRVRVYNIPEGARGDIVQIAMAQQGKQYRSGNKGPDYFDCSGLVYFSYRQVGIPVPKTVDLLGRSGAEISRGDVQPGDLVIFKIKNDDHIGIMINRAEFVHASKSRGVAVDSVDSVYWRKYLVGFRSLM